VKKNGRKIKKYYFLKESTLTGGLGRRKVTRNSKKRTGSGMWKKHFTLTSTTPFHSHFTLTKPFQQQPLSKNTSPKNHSPKLTLISFSLTKPLSKNTSTTTTISTATSLSHEITSTTTLHSRSHLSQSNLIVLLFFI
jgi:hypothetical protein